MKKINYFWEKANGVNADLERHRAREAELQDKIRALEDLNDPMAEATLRTYRHFLNQLLASKAQVLEQLGRKKKR